MLKNTKAGVPISYPGLLIYDANLSFTVSANQTQLIHFEHEGGMFNLVQK